MSDSSWSKIEALFHKAIELPSQDRESFLMQACEDRRVLSEVLRLISSDPYAAAFMETNSAHRQGMARPEIGTRVGPYELAQHLGSGGMGTVYLAHRIDGEFQKDVAIKFLQYHLSDDAVQRFFFEKEILASLDHPNICKLIDAGVADEGQPYFVMEYVDGQDLIQYAQPLGLDQRLNLFLQICHAVDYAHKNLVVHRDLKPGNILVDSQGNIRLLDFGISKMLKRGSHQVTLTLHQLMTPDYASPEQVNGQPISVATDVYGLGLLLYELISGRRPFDRESRSDLAQLSAAIVSKQPPLPSLNYAPTEGTAAADRKRWQYALKQDLDWVCLKALEKDPQNRYASALDLVHDIEHFLNGEPVSERRHHRLYRTQKFLKRNLWTMAYSTLFIAILLAAALFHTHRLAEERNSAQLEAEKSQQMANFLASLFDSTSPMRITEKSLTAKSLLDQGVKRLDDELEEGEVRAELKAVMGNLYYQLGHYESSLQLLTQAYTFYDQQIEGDPQRLAKTRVSLSNAHTKLEQYDLAHLNLDLATDYAQSRPASSLLISCYTNYILLYWKQSLLDKALEYCQMALSAYQQCHDCQPYQLGVVYHRFGLLNYQKGELDEALIWYEKAMDLAEPDDETKLIYAGDLMGLADVLNIKGEFKRAEKLVLEAMEIRLQSLELNHPSIGQSHHFLGMIYRKQGRWIDSEQHYRKALEIRQQALSSDHPDTALTKTNLGILLREMGRFDEAEPLYRQALASLAGQWGNSHWRIGVAYNNLGRLLLDMQRLAEAKACIVKARAIFIDTVGPQHHYVGITWINEGFLLLTNQDWDQSQAAFFEAQRIIEAALGQDNHRISLIFQGLARIAMGRQQFEEARSMLQQSREIARREYGDVDHRTAEIEIVLVQCLIELDEISAAQSIWQDLQAAQILQRIHSPYHVSAQETLRRKLHAKAP